MGGNEVPLYSGDLLNPSVFFVNTVLMGTYVIIQIMTAVLTIHALLLSIMELVKGNTSQQHCAWSCRMAQLTLKEKTLRKGMTETC